MDDVIALVGFGEAGQAFAEGWRLAPERLRAHDIATGDSERSQQMWAAFRARSVKGCDAAAEAVQGAVAVFCLVPTDQAIRAAEAVGPLLDQGTLWLDGSSSAPGTKRRASEVIGRGNGHYVDMAIMAPVHPKLHRTPVLLAGAHAEAARLVTLSLGMVSRVVGQSIGDASAVKMLRSVMIKGIEALSAECFLAARRAGVEDLVFESLSASSEEAGWPQRTAYNLGRMTEHGVRRAAEMREVARTLKELDMPNWMSTSTAMWQERLAGRPAIEGDDVGAGLEAILATFS